MTELSVGRGRYAASALLLVMLLVFGISPAMPAEPLRLSVSQTPLSLPFYVADSRGYFSAEGLTVKINYVIGGHRTLKQVFDGAADCATSSEAVVMSNSFQRSDYAIIATFVTSNDDVKVITRAGSGITRPRQLAGKRVATVVGAASHYYLDTLLLSNGVDPRSVRLRNLQPEAMAKALKNGEVDAIAIWEPFPFKTLKNVPDTIMLPQLGTYRLTFNLIVSKKLLGARDDELAGVLRALNRANRFISEQPRSAQAILRERLKLDQAFIDWIWTRYTYRLTLDQSLLTTLEGEARWARQEGYVKGTQSPNYLNYIYSAPLGRVLPPAVSIVR